MSTCAEIITWAKRQKSTADSDATLLLDLQDIQNQIFLELREFHEAFGKYTVKEYTTVADQLEYTLDSGMTWENIFYVKMFETTAKDTFNEFEYRSEIDDKSTGYIWYRETSGKIALKIEGEEIGTAGLTIQVYYNKTPTTISSTSQTPDLRTEYHILFKYALAKSLCKQGDNPDIELANFYKQEYYEFLEYVKKDLTSRFGNTPYITNQKVETW